METTENKRTVINLLPQETHLLTWIDAFLLSCKAENKSKATLEFYHDKLKKFTAWCDVQAITQITQLTPGIIRDFLLYLDSTGHKPGGIHAHFRTLRAFLYWWENETEPEGWKNPIRKVKAPRVELEPLDPVNFDDLRAMLDTCKKGEFLGERDRAIFLALLDTGCRAGEFLNIDISDLDPVKGEILLRATKGKRPRLVFLGEKSRKAVRVYLRRRSDLCKALWVTESRTRLTYSGLVQITRRRAVQAGCKRPELHSFRRGCALAMLRSGSDVVSVSRILGHSRLEVTQRYLKQTAGDLAQTHREHGPVDNEL